MCELRTSTRSLRGAGGVSAVEDAIDRQWSTCRVRSRRDMEETKETPQMGQLAAEDAEGDDDADGHIVSSSELDSSLNSESESLCVFFDA